MIAVRKVLIRPVMVLAHRPRAQRVVLALQLPEGDLVGQTLGFTGAVTLKSASDPWLVTVIEVTR